MEGGKPEDVSLLAGGAERPLIPVQGGGGMKPSDDFNINESVLTQDGASENPEIMAMSGGAGFWDFFSRTPAVAAAAPQAPIGAQGPAVAFDSLWTSLSGETKAQIIRDTGETILEAKNRGATDTELSELIPETLLKNTLDAVDKQYGMNDQDIEKLLKYGTAEQVEAGRKKYLALKAAGKSDQDTLKEVEEEMAKHQVQGPSTRIPDFARRFLSREAQKIYRTFEERVIYRNEYQFNIGKPLDKTHPMIVWLDKLDIKYKNADRFGRYMNDYIQSQMGAWSVIKTSTGKSPNSKMAALSGSTYVAASISGDRRVTCLDKSIEHVVVIPPLEELKTYNDNEVLDTTAILKMVLRDLYDLNVFNIDEEAGTCKINKKVALVFASAYTAETTTYRSVFLYTSTLEMQNKYNVFSMSNFSENEVKAGLYLLNLITKEQTQSMEIPTLLSPCGILYPFKMKNVDGIFIGCNFNEECSKNIFAEVYRSPYYGKQGCGLFVSDRTSFVKCNRSILRYNYVVNKTDTDFLEKIIYPETESLPALDAFQSGLVADATAGNEGSIPDKTRDSLAPALNTVVGKLKTVKAIRDLKLGDKDYLSIKDNQVNLRILIWGLFYVVDGLDKLGGELRRILGDSFDNAVVGRASVTAAVYAVYGGADDAAKAAARAANPKAVNIYLILDLLLVNAGAPNKDHKIYLNRGQYIILTELFIYIRNNLDAIIDDLAAGPQSAFRANLKTDIKKFLNGRIDSVTYTRFPLKEDYTHYIELVEEIGKKKALSEIYTDVSGLKTGIAGGGGQKPGVVKRKRASRQKKKQSRKLMIGGGRCGEKHVQKRGKGLGLFDLEQFTPYTICTFSIKKRASRDYEDGSGDVCREESERIRERGGNVFTQWSVEAEIANVANLQIIDVGDKTYAVRTPSEAVSCNWSGYKSKQDVPYVPIGPSDLAGGDDLLNASRVGDVQQVRRLIETTPAIVGSKDTTSDMGALHIASQAGRLEVVKLLLEKGADINAVATKSGRKTALHFACENGRSGVVKALLEKVIAAAPASILQTLNADAADNMKAIHFACKGGFVEVLNELLAKYPDAEKAAGLIVQTEGGKTPLYFACEGAHAPIVEILLRSIPADAIIGAEFNENSPLAISLKKGKSAITEILLRKLGVPSFEGLFLPAKKNPLHFACEGGSVEVVKQVLNKRGASAADDINLYSGPDEQDGIRTSLQIACEKGHVEIVHELLSRLADKAAGINKFTDLRVNSLHLACKGGYTRVVQELLNALPDAARIEAIKVVGNDNMRPIHFACEGGHAETVKELLGRLPPAEKGIVIEQPNLQGNKPIHLACKSGKAETIREVLKAYADERARIQAIGAAGQDAKTPLHFACEGGKAEVVKLIFDIVAEVNTDKAIIRNDTMAVLNQPLAANTIKPIHVAAKQGSAEIMREILDRIVKVYAAAPAAPAAVPAVAPATVSEAITQQLLTNKANAQNETALHIVCKEGNTESLKEILGSIKKINGLAPSPIIDARADSGKTPLIVAAENNLKGVAQVLIAGGANKTLVNSTGQTAEAIATEKQFREIRDVLIQSGGAFQLLPDIPVNIDGLAGGNLCDKVQQDVPVLVKGEAELLNDLNLTPTNMKEIFSPENHYATNFNYPSLKSWGTAIEMFFRNLTVQKCYENRLLLTTSECEEAKCFLYSIRDYFENPVNETEARKRFLNDGDAADMNEATLEDDVEVQLSKISIAEPQYSISDGKPMVRVGAIEKSSNKRVHFNLKLSKDSDNKGQRYPTDAEIEELKELFEKKQMQYKSKYVMYLY